MTPSVRQFWKRTVQSRVLSADQCRQLATRFARAARGKQVQANVVAGWLVREGHVTRDQAKLLLRDAAEAARDLDAKSDSDSVAIRATETSIAASSENTLPEITIDAPDHRLERHRRKTNRGPHRILRRRVWIAALICGGLGLALVAGFWLGSSREAGPILDAAVDDAAGDSSRHVPEASETERRLDARDPVSPASGHVARIESLQSDAPWESPTTGEPLDLAYVPSGAQLLLSWRPRDFLSLPEGERVLDVLGHYGEMARDRLPELAGTSLENIEQILVAVSVGDNNDLDTTLVIRPYEAVDPDELLRAWNADRFESVSEGMLLRGDPYARFLPESDRGPQQIVVVGLARVDALLAEGGAAPLLPRDLESLVATSDASRHFNLLFVPRFANEQGQSLLVGELTALHQPLVEFLGDEVSAAALSVHLDENLFLELRAMPRLEQTPRDTSDALLGRLDALSATAHAWVDALTKSTRGAELLERWPAMLELAAAQTRQHVDSRQVVLRAYLPSIAAHNLVLATRFALWHRAGGHLESAPAAALDGNLAMAARLRSPVTLRFSSDTLEGALARLGELIDAKITIQGGDLQLEGITQNQSFAIDQRERPATDVLETILRRASPEGKLIYIIGVVESADGSQEEVISVTTRASAVQRGDVFTAEETTQDDGK